MKIPNMPTYVEDTYGRKYSVPQSEVRIGGQGAFFQKDDLAVKILFPEQYSVTIQRSILSIKGDLSI